MARPESWSKTVGSCKKIADAIWTLCYLCTKGMKDGGGGDVAKEEHGRRHAEDMMSGHLKPAVYF